MLYDVHVIHVDAHCLGLQSLYCTKSLTWQGGKKEIYAREYEKPLWHNGSLRHLFSNLPCLALFAISLAPEIFV